jgi:hypothetical protein
MHFDDIRTWKGAITANLVTIAEFSWRRKGIASEKSVSIYVNPIEI